MPVVQIEPTKSHPVPYDLSEDKPSTPIKAVEIAGNTAELQVALGASLEVTEAITNKLMELANCGDPRYELKALELLGKHSDIGIFTERSEITVNYKNPEDLEKAIKERVKNLLNATVVDTIPLSECVDEALGTTDD